ncbi:hypothetical protein [Marinobacter nauticus]|uniref:Uncharacterized protein n=1 Tax=Marinobacter nauticus TaxID=2743 RepID=A0A833NBC1_MARNT|nr:hypothetical protein [Marinobacter nauticus]KAE8546188.1 hypothetical protein F6453_1434 [Marinobacter nauticus]
MEHPNNRKTRQLDILTNGTRQQVIDWLTWNDHNGVYTDEDCINEGLPVLTLEQAREIMRNQLESEGIL